MSGIIFKKKQISLILIVSFFIASGFCYYFNYQGEKVAGDIIKYTKTSNFESIVALACNEGELIIGSKEDRAKVLYDSIKATSDLSYVVKDRFPYLNVYLKNSQNQNNVAYLVISYQSTTNSFCFYKGVL